MLRIQQITKDGMLDEYGLEPEVVAEIVDYIDINKKKLREPVSYTHLTLPTNREV